MSFLKNLGYLSNKRVLVSFFIIDLVSIRHLCSVVGLKISFFCLNYLIYYLIMRLFFYTG